MLHSKLQRAHSEKSLPKLILKILLPDFISKLLNFKRLGKSEVAEVLSNQHVDTVTCLSLLLMLFTFPSEVELLPDILLTLCSAFKSL